MLLFKDPSIVGAECDTQQMSVEHCGVVPSEESALLDLSCLSLFSHLMSKEDVLCQPIYHKVHFVFLQIPNKSELVL